MADGKPEPRAARLRGNGLEQAGAPGPEADHEQHDVRREVAYLHVHDAGAERLHEPHQERGQRDDRNHARGRNADDPGGQAVSRATAYTIEKTSRATANHSGPEAERNLPDSTKSR